MGYKIYDNREISWLKFNKRVLEEAEDHKNPLCERLSFASIFQSNLDEFYMVRAGYLMAQINSDATENKTGLTCKEQLNIIGREVHNLLKYKDYVYSKLMEELEAYGVKNVRFQELSEDEKEKLTTYFREEIKPFLSPQIVGKRQPFPFLKNQEIYAVVELRTKNDNRKIGIIPSSSGVLKRIVPISENGLKFMLLEEVILHFVDEIFDKYSVQSKSLIRIIRSADIDVDDALSDEEADYRKAVEAVLKTRKKLSPVKLDYSRVMDDTIVEKLCGYINLGQKSAYHSEAPLDLSYLFTLQGMLRDKKELFFEPRIPQKSPVIDDNSDMISQILKKDVLLSYPYENIRPFLRLLSEAAADPTVVSIKMTLYRVASNSKVIEALMEAAENGKEVIVLVELKARFDEENNINWSRQLEDAGCRVIYGLDHIKVHSKLCLITRKGENHIDYITQIGTGNYNEKTAKIYTDYSLMTSSREIGKEAGEVFNALAMGRTVDNTKHLLVAPDCLQNKIVDMIEAEIEKVRQGGEGFIGLKLNSLTDKVLIDKLTEAGRKGVKIRMVIRGICCLKAGIKGITDNIEVISIVGRFLEHSRVYIFGKDDNSRVYISSADFMTRNTTRRVEIAVPVYDNTIKARLLEDFDVFFKDTVKARAQVNGIYESKHGDNEINAQEYFYERAYQRA